MSNPTPTEELAQFLDGAAKSLHSIWREPSPFAQSATRLRELQMMVHALVPRVKELEAENQRLRGSRRGLMERAWDSGYSARLCTEKEPHKIAPRRGPEIDALLAEEPSRAAYARGWTTATAQGAAGTAGEPEIAAREKGGEQMAENSNDMNAARTAWMLARDLYIESQRQRKTSESSVGPIAEAIRRAREEGAAEMQGWLSKKMVECALLQAENQRLRESIRTLGVTLREKYAGEFRGTNKREQFYHAHIRAAWRQATHKYDALLAEEPSDGE